MKEKLTLLEELELEKSQLENRRDLLLTEIDIERAESSEEYVDATVDDMLLKLQTIVDQIFKLDNTIYELRIMKARSGKLGQGIKIGDCVTLKNSVEHKHYYITNDSQYVNPSLGIISANSPIAQKLLDKKFGEELEMTLNGTNIKFELIP